MEHLGSFAWRLAGDGPTLFSTWVEIPALETVEMLGHAGSDVVVVDMEHAACGDAIAVADVRGCWRRAVERTPERNTTLVDHRTV